MKKEWLQLLLSEQGPRTPKGRPDPTRRHVLHALSRFMDASGGQCYPSMKRLAAMTGLSVKSVEVHLQGAEAAGWIERERRGREGRAWRQYRYQATLPAPEAGSGPQPTDDPKQVRVPRVRGPEARSGAEDPKHVRVVKARGPEPDDNEDPNLTPWGPERPSGEVVREASRERVVTPTASTPPSGNSPARTRARARRGGEQTDERQRARSILRDVCLGGLEEATDENGKNIGLGLLLDQWDGYIEHGVDPGVLNGMLEVIRTCGEGPPGGGAFSLRWIEGPRFSRLEGAYFKSLGPTGQRGGEPTSVSDIVAQVQERAG